MGQQDSHTGLPGSAVWVLTREVSHELGRVCETPPKRSSRVRSLKRRVATPATARTAQGERVWLLKRHRA